MEEAELASLSPSQLHVRPHALAPAQHDRGDVQDVPAAAVQGERQGAATVARAEPLLTLAPTLRRAQAMYMWNLFLTRELEACVGHLSASFWILPIAHGAFLQRKCTLFGRIVNLRMAIITIVTIIL